MPMLSPQTRYVLDRPWRFAGRVIASFRANQGFLLLRLRTQLREIANVLQK